MTAGKQTHSSLVSPKAHTVNEEKRQKKIENMMKTWTTVNLKAPPQQWRRHVILAFFLEAGDDDDGCGELFVLAVTTSSPLSSLSTTCFLKITKGVRF
jgi:hypothetical protein